MFCFSFCCGEPLWLTHAWPFVTGNQFCCWSSQRAGLPGSYSGATRIVLSTVDHWGIQIHSIHLQVCKRSILGYWVTSLDWALFLSYKNQNPCKEVCQPSHKKDRTIYELHLLGNHTCYTFSFLTPNPAYSTQNYSAIYKYALLLAWNLLIIIYSEYYKCLMPFCCVWCHINTRFICKEYWFFKKE